MLIMDKITCDLKNCYGIQNFQHEFDFTESNAISIYARNGLMKTSFSKTFKKIQEGKVNDIKDEVFDIPATVDIKIDGNAIQKEDVFVIKSFESYYESNSVASLLVDDDIKGKITSVLKKRDKLLKLLEKYSGLKISKTSLGKKVFELEPQIIRDFAFLENSFLMNVQALTRMNPEIRLDRIKYGNIFDNTVLKKIKTPEFQEKIEAFCVASDGIYASYGFLNKGSFTLPKLKNLSKTLENDRFFVNSNYVYLNGGYEIRTPEELKQKIDEVEEKIKQEPAFQEIEKMLSDSKGIVLKELIENNSEVIPYLKSDKLNDLRKQLWLSYIACEHAAFEELLTEYQSLEKEINEIDLNTTMWKRALDVFEERFTVPYKMKISNLKGAIIGESIPRVEFSFERDGKIAKLERSELESIDILSQGEKRALYLLNIIFDIEMIKDSGRKVLFVIDDIADSFDYKNKYAIVEYLYEMSINSNFRLIILSHNFDFYRTVSTRLALSRGDRLSAEQEGTTIVLKEEKYQDKPFIAWKKDMSLENVLALIPFVRNMIEYGVDKNEANIIGVDSDYLVLTHLLHEKSRTNDITFGTLRTLYKSYLGKDRFKFEIADSEKVIDKIYEIADSIMGSVAQLEHKIILAIAIRHKAEVYMLKEIGSYTGTMMWKVKKNMATGTSNEFIANLDSASNQTRELFGGFKQFGGQEAIRVLDEVNIMTPENIHLNSFMYEPIIDMDINELLNLYHRVKQL